MTRPTWFDWITLLAIFVGPVAAILTQRLIDSSREQSQRRDRVFLTLMSTRATPLAPDHINTLNSIDVVFDRRRGGDVKVRSAWAKLLAHIVTDTNAPQWQEKYNDLKVDLLREIAVETGYPFVDTDYLKRQFYYPKAFGDLELDQLKLRKALASALTEEGLKIIPGNATAPEKTAGG
jgi:hypothetical protein